MDLVRGGLVDNNADIAFWTGPTVDRWTFNPPTSVQANRAVGLASGLTQLINLTRHASAIDAGVAQAELRFQSTSNSQEFFITRLEFYNSTTVQSNVTIVAANQTAFPPRPSAWATDLMYMDVPVSARSVRVIFGCMTTSSWCYGYLDTISLIIRPRPTALLNVTATGDGSMNLAVSVGMNGVGLYYFDPRTGNFPAILSSRTDLLAWTMVTVVIASNTPSIYLNGSLAIAGQTVTTNVRFSGAGFSSMLGPYEGMLSDVRVYNRSLTNQEIATLYTRSDVGGESEKRREKERNRERKREREREMREERFHR
jgi:hypothetical protein